MLFWRRQQFDPRESEKLQKLEEQLRQAASVVHLSMKEKQAMKRQIFASISQQDQQEAFLPQSLKVLGSHIREVGQNTLLSIPHRVRIKQRIFSFIQQTNWLGMAFGPFRSPRFLKTIVSSALLFFFVVTAVLIFPFQVPLTYAARLTYIDEVSGQVFVMRSGEILQAKKDFALVEGDVLITKDNSFVTVRFFDDSVSRLDSNTQLEVTRLYSEPLNPVDTKVELSLQDGHLWTRVLNLFDEGSHFMITTPSASATVTKKAAFDLQTHVYDTTLSVFDNVVDFAPGSNSSSSAESRPVLAGFQAQVSQQDGSSVTKIIPVSQGLQGNKAAAQWVESNMNKDKIHTEVLAQENQQDLEIKTGLTDALQTGSDTDVVKTLSNPEIDQERKHFLDAYQRLILGETYLARQQGSQGLPLIFEFEATVRSIMLQYPDFLAKDPLNANLLFSLMQSKIAQQRKDLSMFLPGDPLYPVKEELDNTLLYLTGSDVDKAKMQLSQSEDKLLEVQDLLGKNKFEQAQAVLVRYQRQIDNLVLKVNSGNVSELQDKLVSLFEQQVEQIKELTSIEKSLFETQSDLIKQVRDLRQQVLEKLMTAMEKVNSDLPMSLIQELRDLLQTYVDNGKYDDAFVQLLNKMLLKYGKNVATGAKTKLPSELGVVTIVEEDATAAVKASAEQSSTQQNKVLPKQDGGATAAATAESVADSNTTQQSCGTQQCGHNCRAQQCTW